MKLRCLQQDQIKHLFNRFNVVKKVAPPPASSVRPLLSPSYLLPFLINDPPHHLLRRMCGGVSFLFFHRAALILFCFFFSFSLAFDFL